MLNAGRGGEVGEGHGENRVFSCRSTVLDTMFSLRVGMERVMLQSRMQELVAPHGVEAGRELWAKFKDSGRAKATREQMATAMLVGVAFKKLMETKI